MQGEIDETDKKILALLQQNGKLSTKELGAAVNLSSSPVFERQKRLEREGYIEKYVAKLNPEKTGNGFIVLCNVKLAQHTRENGMAFKEAIMKLNEVTECYNTSGDYDFMMKIYVKNMRHYQDFVLNTLGAIPSIGNLHSIFVIGEVKNTNEIPID